MRGWECTGSGGCSSQWPPTTFIWRASPPETNIAPENGRLEKEIPIGNQHFKGRAVSFRGYNPSICRTWKIETLIFHGFVSTPQPGGQWQINTSSHQSCFNDEHIRTQQKKTPNMQRKSRRSPVQLAGPPNERAQELRIYKIPWNKWCISNLGPQEYLWLFLYLRSNPFLKTWHLVLLCFEFPNFLRHLQLPYEMVGAIRVAGGWCIFLLKEELFETHRILKITAKPRWWFQTVFYVHPYLAKWSNLTTVFQLGWFNHQLENHRVADMFVDHLHGYTWLMTPRRLEPRKIFQKSFRLEMAVHGVM